MSLAFVWGIHQWLVNSPHKGTVTWKMFPFDDVIIDYQETNMLPECLTKSQSQYSVCSKLSDLIYNMKSSGTLYVSSLLLDRVQIRRSSAGSV